MKNRDEPAQPLDKAMSDAVKEGYWPTGTGLTKLEDDFFIGLRMVSVAAAHALFDELEKENDKDNTK